MSGNPTAFKRQMVASLRIPAFRRSALARLTAVLSTWTIVVASSLGAETLATFTLREMFGIAHPDQVVEFAYTNPAVEWWTNCALLGSDGTEVAYQALSDHRIAVRTDLKANSTNTWTLVGERAPTVHSTQHAVGMSVHADYYEITNGLTGVRLFRPGTMRRIPIQSITVTGHVAVVRTTEGHALETATHETTLAKDPGTHDNLSTAQLLVSLVNVPAPLQSLNGLWLKPRLNVYWSPQAQASELSLLGAPMASGSARGGTLLVTNTCAAPIQGLLLPDGRWTAQGTRLLKTDVYTPFNRRVLNATWVSLRFVELGPLKTVVELTYHYSNSQPGTPTRFYRSTITVQAGQPTILIEEFLDQHLIYELDLTREVRPDHVRWRRHGEVYGAADYATPVAGLGTASVARWSYWTEPYYWQFYNSRDGASAPVVGLFCIQASRLIGANTCFPGVFGNATRSGLFFQANYNSSDPTHVMLHRVAWAIYTGSKGASLLATNLTQPIALQRNLHSVFGLTKYAAIDFDFNYAATGTRGLYIESSVVSNMVRRLRSGDLAYAQSLKRAEPYSADLVEMWADPSGAATHKQANAIFDKAATWLNRLLYQQGNMQVGYTYWSGGYEMARQIPYIVSLLEDPLATDADRAKVKAAASLYSEVIWDDDFAPLDFATNKMSAGTANMPQQMVGFRKQFALAFPEQARMASLLEWAKANTVTGFAALLNESGAPFGCPHYIAPALQPNLVSALQLRLLGVDPFASQERLRLFGEFVLHLATPPEPRFRNLRKLVAHGDGSTESSVLPGLMATGHRTANPALSSRLAWLWQAMARPHNNFYGTTLMMIDDSWPAVDAQLTRSAAFPGYAAILRHGWGTVDESVLWLFAGDYYSDHRHDDKGSLCMYALGAPLSVGWGGVYTPHTGGSVTYSMVVPESQHTNWNKSAQNIETPGGWSRSTNTLFLSFLVSSAAEGAMTHLNGLHWTRRVMHFFDQADQPITVVQDRFAGTRSKDSKILTWTLMATGRVGCPSGVYQPPVPGAGTGPSAGATLALSLGLQPFSFTGYAWNAHPTRGIDFDMHVLGGSAFNIGNWGHTSHPSTEVAEFQQANGRPFEERQHLLRIKGSGGFTSVLVPWKKGRKPADFSVKQYGEGVKAILGSSQTEIHEDWYVCDTQGRRILTTFGNTVATVAGLAIGGGPTEVILESKKATITAHGTRGLRRIQLPFAFASVTASGSDPRVTLNLNEVLLNYDSDKPVTIVVQ